MTKKKPAIIKYYMNWEIVYRIKDYVRYLAISDLIFFTLYLLGISFFGVAIFTQTFVAAMVMLVEILILVHLHLYELKNSDWLVNKEQLNCSTDEVIRILRESKKVLTEVENSDCKDIYKELDFARHEVVKVRCCKSWIMRTEEDSDAFRRIQTTEQENMEYLGKVLSQKDELFTFYASNSELQKFVLEQYNRVKRKVLEWPKVISK